MRRRQKVVRALKRKPRLRAGIAILASVLGAFILGMVIPTIPIGFETNRQETVEFLIAVAAGVLTFTGVVYSLLFLVVQYASTTFTPRLNPIRESPAVLYAFGYFTGVFVFAVTAPFAIGDDPNVTGLVVIFQVLLLMGLLAALILLQESALGSIQLSEALAQVGQRGRSEIIDFYPDLLDQSQPRPARGTEVRWQGDTTVLQVIDVERVRRASERSNCVVAFRVRVGQTLFHRTLLAVIDGPPDQHVANEVVASLTTGADRTSEQDATFMFRVLADIALRALSPGINDPTTAVQALDTLEGLLREVLIRDLDVGEVADAKGNLRVTLPLPTWDEFLGVALDEILDLPGPPMLQVRTRIEHLLDDLAAIATPDRMIAIRARQATLKSISGDVTPPVQ